MDISYEQAGHLTRLAAFTLELGESVKVLHSNQIVAFQGSPSLREDSFMKLSGMYRKKRLLQSNIRGPVKFMLGLPEGYSLGTVEIKENDNLLFEFRHVLFYTKEMKFRTQVQKVRNVMMTHDFVKMKFQGPGTLGLLTSGPLYPIQLDPEVPLYVDIQCLVAYPEHVSLTPCVYGNTLASQNMNYHWELKGSGTVLLQPCKPDKQLDEQMQSDSLLRRVLRELIPFGGVFIK
ncbi:AIM24 family protein [Paenibacillus sp. RC67]|uniref:AIM24 family protein n=1 Tax=Paenibacillus sp. RC67 TaxID=3039392 RepID=UPI0024AE56F0|nr:AIM24 family protein [Paenibacillus sp. RC67]